MRFILVNIQASVGDSSPIGAGQLAQWRATCIDENIAVDVFFFAAHAAAAKAHIRRIFPAAKFSDERTS